jgi:hypothetical protein
MPEIGRKQRAKKNEATLYDSEDLYGFWINPVSTDSIINLSVDYWGGLADYEWKIISIEMNKLIVLRLKEEYHST